MAAQRAVGETARAWHAKLAEDFAQRACASTSADAMCSSALTAWLDFPSRSSDQVGVEDWEEFFVEKSRRRADKERRAERKRRNEALVAAAVICLLLAVGIVGLALR
jgi:hypothetical protein